MKMGQSQINYKSKVSEGGEPGRGDVDQSHVKFHEPSTSSSCLAGCLFGTKWHHRG